MLQHFTTIDCYKKTFNETCNENFDKTTLHEIKTYESYQFKIARLLPKQLESKNHFNKAKRLIDGIEVDMNKVKARKEDKMFLMI